MLGFVRLLCHAVIAVWPVAAALAPVYQGDFPAAEFRERRAKVFDKIGNNAVALVQGAAVTEGFGVFRQSNEFYYLCGIETPHSYLLLDGRSRTATLFLPHRDEARELNAGKVLSFEDANTVAELTGVDAVAAIESLAGRLGGLTLRPPAPALYTPFSPAEGMAASRDELLRFAAETAADPWDGRQARQAHFVSLLRARFPSIEVRDLSPILDQMRIVKSPREAALIRRASRIAGLGIMEAIRSTRPGGYEYQLDAAARYVFLVNGARFEAYPSISAGGQNAWMGHYMRNDAELKGGDLVLMDFGPDYRYYTGDVTRMWPVNGTYTKDQRALCDFILALRGALLTRIRAGATADGILAGARAELEPLVATMPFTKEIYRSAARKALEFRGHLSHPVGMTVHDVGDYRRTPFAAGVVFALDPMMWIPEEKLYVRMEDTVMVTESGVENFTDFMPARPDDIEKLMKEQGVVQLRPSQAK